MLWVDRGWTRRETQEDGNMDKETWKQHMETSTGLTRPSAGGALTAWKEAYQYHKLMDCADCKARVSTAKRSASQRAYNDGMRSLGLTRVVGAVSNKVYWE